ncbi:ribonuclease H-like domain-containing protein [Tanacetum coccineum]
MSLHGFTDDEYEADDNQPTLISKLNLSSPLHLHPNDSATLTVVSVKLKSTEDYQVWSCAMLLALEGKNKTGFIDGSCRRSNTDEVLGRQWDRVNDVVLGLILNSISEELLNAMWKQFDALVQLPRCTCHAADDFKKHNQLMKLMQFLMGLDDCYMQIRSNILSRDELPDIRSAYAIISSEESHRRSQASTSNTRPSTVTRPLNNGNRRPNGGSTLVCENCGFNGHTIDICFKIIGYPADFGKRNGNNNSSNQGVQNFNKRFVNNNNSFGSSSNSFSDDQISKLITLIKENSLNSTGKGVQANMAGANQHLTYTDKDLVNVIDISYLGIIVSHPNGTKACITKVGNMVLNKTLTLYDVLVVPDNCVSLMSVHKLARDNNLIVAFDESKCFVLPQYLRDLKVLRTGNQIDGLYYFDKGIHVVCSLTKGVWHSRLGHPSEHALKVLKNDINFEETKIDFFEICQMAKQTREPFLLSDHKSLVLGELVHLDLWGPYKVTSKEGFRFFLTVVDGYTRAIWVYMLKLPSSVLNGDSPYKLVFNRKPNLNHLRVFGCLCYATILTNSDKFSSRSEKCVLVGYFSVKKGYKLYSLERKHFIFSRDAKFVENVFPFKTITTFDHSQDLDHSNFFNNLDVEIPDTPYDEERVANKSDSDGSNSSQDGSPTFDHQEDAEMPSYGSNGSATENEMAATPEDTNISSEGVIGDVQHTKVENNDAQPVRRSERSSVFPKRYNDFVVDSKVKYSLEKYVNYSKLSYETKCFVTELNKSVEPRNYWEAYKDQHWVEAMNKEMDALYKNDTRDITDLPIGRKSIGGKQVYKIKYKSSGKIERYKARYVVKGYNQKEGIDFNETFSPVVKIVTVRCLINLAVQNNWCLSQLDINNAFLYGDLSETVYMDLPKGYFSPDDKRPSATPLEQNLSITNEPTDIDKVLDNITEYPKLIGKLIYLTHTGPDISYSVHCNPGKGVHIVRQPKASLEAFVDAYWANKKQHTLSKSSAEAEYRAMDSVTSEVVWILKVLKELEWDQVLHVNLFCDSQAAIKIAANPVFHERTKHLEIDLHFIRDKILAEVIKTQKIGTTVQPADIFTKGLDKLQHENLVSKLGLIDVFQVKVKGGC